jgi:hypothetical protein
MGTGAPTGALRAFDLPLLVAVPFTPFFATGAGSSDSSSVGVGEGLWVGVPSVSESESGAAFFDDLDEEERLR